MSGRAAPRATLAPSRPNGLRHPAQPKRDGSYRERFQSTHRARRGRPRIAFRVFDRKSRHLLSQDSLADFVELGPCLVITTNCGARCVNTAGGDRVKTLASSITTPADRKRIQLRRHLNLLLIWSRPFVSFLLASTRCIAARVLSLDSVQALRESGGLSSNVCAREWAPISSNLTMALAQVAAGPRIAVFSTW